MNTCMPTRFLASRCGSAVHIRKAEMSLAYCSTVIGAPVRERRRHRDGMAGKIFIVEAGGRKGDARRRRVLVAVQQRGEVVDALLLVLREYIADPAGKAALVTARLGDDR